jgi:DNA-binding IscR family transcriptional regulator
MLSKKTKYGIKALTFWPAEKIKHLSPLQILPKAKTFRLSFRKYFAAFSSFRIFGCQKRKGGGYYLIKSPKILISKSIILEGPIALLPCASHNFYEK